MVWKREEEDAAGGQAGNQAVLFLAFFKNVLYELI